MSQCTLRPDASKPDPTSRFDIGLVTHTEPANNEESQEMVMRTRQVSATTAEVPVFYKAASLKDEGGLLRSDGVRESWNLKTGQVPKLKEPERMWGESSRGWAEGSKMWITVNDRVVRGRDGKVRRVWGHKGFECLSFVL